MRAVSFFSTSASIVTRSTSTLITSAAVFATTRSRVCVLTEGKEREDEKSMHEEMSKRSTRRLTRTQCALLSCLEDLCLIRLKRVGIRYVTNTSTFRMFDIRNSKVLLGECWFGQIIPLSALTEKTFGGRRVLTSGKHPVWKAIHYEAESLNPAASQVRKADRVRLPHMRDY